MTFLVSVAHTTESFLKEYQSDKPMLPFMATDLETQHRTLLQKFMKSSIVQAAGSVIKLLDLDLKSNVNHKPVSELELGFVTDLEIKKAKSAKTVSDKDILQFKMECKHFLVTLCEHIKEKHPLQHRLVKKSICLDPQKINIHSFKMVLDTFQSLKRISVEECDATLNEYRSFLADAKLAPKFLSLKKVTDRLDFL